MVLGLRVAGRDRPARWPAARRDSLLAARRGARPAAPAAAARGDGNPAAGVAGHAQQPRTFRGDDRLFRAARAAAGRDARLGGPRRVVAGDGARHRAARCCAGGVLARTPARLARAVRGRSRRHGGLDRPAWLRPALDGRARHLLGAAPPRLFLRHLPQPDQRGRVPESGPAGGRRDGVDRAGAPARPPRGGRLRAGHPRRGGSSCADRRRRRLFSLAPP